MTRPRARRKARDLFIEIWKHVNSDKCPTVIFINGVAYKPPRPRKTRKR